MRPLVASGGLDFLLPFGAVIAVSVAIIVWAARRTRTAADYFVAGGRITAGQNALALAGDFVGVGGFFAITGLIALHGADGYVFAIGAVCGFPLMLFLFAEPLKRLGRYTVADVLTTEGGDWALRALTATTQLVVILALLTAQLVGAASLVRLLFGLPDGATLLLLGVVIAAYVLAGGMLATTWLQIVKAAMMTLIAVALAVLALGRFGMDPLRLMGRAVELRGPAILAPGGLFKTPLDTVSLLMGLALGNASMPHVLMRLNTVRDPRAAQRSVFLGTGLIVAFHLVVLLLGFAALVVVGQAAVKAADPGGNMALPLLARALGGDSLLGVVSAVALATILAVVAGLVMAGSAALSHDLFNSVARRGAATPAQELAVGRGAALALVVAALALSRVCQGLNVGFLSALGYAVGAGALFPVLFLRLFWTGLTRAGAAAGMAVGLGTSLVLIALSPTVQVGLLHHAAASFPLQTPAVVATPLAFLAAALVSRLGRRAPGAALAT